MGLTEEFYTALNKKKKEEEQKKSKKKESSVSSLTNDFYTALANNESKNKAKKKDDDIAPVRTTTNVAPATTAKKEEDDSKLDFFQKGAFDDGYQFGDVTKAILGTAGDVGVGVVKGASKMVGGILDAGAYGVAGIADAFGADDFADSLRVKAKENTIDNALKGTNDWLNQYSMLGRTGDAVAEGLGQIGTIILTGGAAAPLGAVGASAATMGALGVSSFGSGMSEAYQSGATDEEAATYGLIKGIVDAGSEMIFGGLGKTVKALGVSKGLSSLDDVFAKKLTEKITNQTAKNFVQFGVKASAEGVEEVLAGIGSAVGKKLTYMEEKELRELIEDENLLEQFVVGAVTSGIAQSGAIPGTKSGSLVEANKTGRDFITGMTESDQKVIDKMVADKIAEKETDGGKKLSKKEKDEVYNEITELMERGEISLDTIAEVVDGESYTAYKDMLAREEESKKSIAELYKNDEAKMQKELDAFAEQAKTENEKARAELDNKVFELVKNGKLAESYYERGRRGEAFTADTSKYNDKQRATIQKAIESGVLNNTRRTHEFVDLIARISADKGVVFDFTSNEKLKDSIFAVGEGKVVNGFVTENGVTLNVNSVKALNSVVGHEITHVLEGTELYSDLSKVLEEYARGRNASREGFENEFLERYHDAREMYKDVEGYKGVDGEAKIKMEVIADLVGDYLFTDADFVNHLTKHRNVFQKIYDEIKYLHSIAKAGTKEEKQLLEVKKAFEKAYGQKNTALEGGAKYSVSETTDGRLVAVVDSNILANIDTSSWDKAKKAEAKKSATDALKRFSKGIVVDGITRKVNKISRQEYTRSKDTEKLFKRSPDVFADKMRAADVADDIVVATTNWNRDGGLKHPRTDNFVDFDHGKTLIMSGDAKYSAEVVVGITDAGEAVFYDVVDMTPATFDIKKEESPTAATTQNAIGAIQGDSSFPKVSQEESDVKPVFSLSKPVEQTKDLMALHNLTEQKLLKSLKLGGLPMPSVAIAKAQDGHDEFGEISIVLPRDTIDPEYSRKNKLYSGDAWTPIYPRVEYKADDKVRKAITNKINNLVPYETRDALGGLHLDADNMNDTLNRYNGDMVDAFKRDDVMKYAYLKDIGSNISLPMKEANLVYYGRVSNDAIRYFSGKLVNGLQTVELYQNMGAKAMMQDDALKEAVADAQNWDVLRSFEPGSEGYLEYERNPVFRADEVSFSDINDFLSGCRKLFQYGVQKTVDKQTARELIRGKVNQTEYEAWLNELFTGIVEKEGIRNNKDYFTPSGNRRSFDALHYEHNLENVIKAMRETGEKGIGFGGGSIFGAATTEFSSVDEMKQSRDRLQKMSDEEYQAMRDGFTNRFFEIASKLPNNKSSFMATDDAANTLVEAVTKYKTRSGIANYLKRELKGWATYSDNAVDDLIKLVRDIRNMPTGYFEAKPQRAVGFDEVGVFVIPNNADTKLKQELLNRGYSIAEYDPNVEGDRTKVLNQFEEYKFSLSNVGNAPKAYGNYNVYGKDIALESAPVQEEVVAENATTTPVSEMFPDSLVPMSDDDTERFDSLSDADAPPEMDAPFYGEQEDLGDYYVEDPFENRDIGEVGDRKVKAYMFENPEVKPFFQEEAKIMLRELQESQKGEKLYADVDYLNDSGYVSHGVWTGQPRITSDEIAYLLDGGWGGKGYTYAQIEKGLKAIIEDNGKENNACSKRIEFLLNDRLKDGYKDFRNGYDIPPDENYLRLLEEKQITEYSKESLEALMAQEDIYAPPISEEIVEEDIAPVAAEKVETPHISEPYEAIKPKKVKEPRMARATPEEQASAEVLIDEPKVDKKKPGAWSWVKEHILDSGMVFEDLSLATGNRELQARWNSIRYATNKAQRLMQKGNAFTISLDNIRNNVESTGKTKQFYEYLYHRHNVDRMTLAERYENTENKPVFGSTVTAEKSQEIADKLEKANPEFKQYAADVYGYMTHLRELLVDGGVISGETAKLWSEMYPHYVPIRRLGDEGLNINVPLDTGRTGVNAPIKRATGGNRDILPLFDTMGQRTIQTYRAIAKNRFGVELKNTLGTTIGNEAMDIDEAIDLDTKDGLLQEGKNGKSPTFTVFENGEKVTFEITEEMYEAMKPTTGILAETSKTLSGINSFRRGLITEYNPVFLATNAIKDAQDVLMNSQHPARTYAALPKAVVEMARGGHWYTEYMNNGGEQNTYFDGQTNTFTEGEKGAKKLLGIPPLSWISKANNVIERLPRLAEYIASRESGRSVDVAMLDAARVTTNFAAGGDLTKFINRNGGTFFGASVQGAVQQVRNIREAKANGLRGALGLAGKVALAGLPVMVFNHLMWDDDEEYDELSDYVKRDYYIVAKYGDGKFVRIPKGRIVSVVQNAFEQIGNAVTGEDVDIMGFGELMLSNLAPNNPIDNNIFAPIMQAATNTSWYGEDIIPTRLQDKPTEEQYDETTDAISKWLGENFDPFGLGAYRINYLLDQYSGGVGDVLLPMLTPEAERGDNSILGNMIAPFADKFTTDSVMKNQNVSDFYETKDELTMNAKKRNATDKDVLMSKYFNSVNAELSNLYKQKREIQNSDLPDDEKYAEVRDIQKQIVELTKEGLNNYPDVSISGGYAEVGDRHYRKNDDGEWTKLTDKQLEKQEEVMSGLDISASEYWSNKEEYDFAYEKPEKYAVAKSVGGYNAYKGYSSELYDIKGVDKDGDGRSDTGTRKEKVLDWINNLDADYGTKIILFKNEYNADDTYNYDIIEYLNSRADISYKDMETILKELGFEVSADGTISW